MDPDWLSGIGTLAAVVWGFFLYFGSVREKSREQARRVYVLPTKEARKRKPGQPIGLSTAAGDQRAQFMVGGAEAGAAIHPGFVHTLRVHNDSAEVITWVRVLLITSRGLRVFNPSAVRWKYVEPSGHRDLEAFVFTENADGMTMHYLRHARPVVQFKDASGLEWEHGLGRPLKRLDTLGVRWLRKCPKPIRKLVRRLVPKPSNRALHVPSNAKPFSEGHRAPGQGVKVDIENGPTLRIKHPEAGGQATGPSPEAD